MLQSIEIKEERNVINKSIKKGDIKYSIDIDIQLMSENTIPITVSCKQIPFKEETLINLLKKINRSGHDIRQIEHLTKELKFFEQINKVTANQKAQLHKKICKHLKFVYLPKGKVVFYEGDVADSFFIVLQGRCLILIKDSSKVNQIQNQQQLNSPLNKEQTPRVSCFFGSTSNEKKNSVSSPAHSGKRAQSLFSKNPLHNHHIQNQKILRWRFLHKIVWNVIYICRFIRYSQKKELDMVRKNNFQLSKLFKIIGAKSFQNEKFQKIRKEIQQTIHPELDLQYLENPPHFFEKQGQQTFIYIPSKVYEKGESFGELGLLSKKPRSATAVCLQDCIFASISKKVYYDTLKEVEQQKIEKKINFIIQTFLPSLKNDEQNDSERDGNQNQNQRGKNTQNNEIQYSQTKLNRMYVYFTKKKFKAGTILQKQDQLIDQLYVIKKGEVSCFLNVANDNNLVTQKLHLSILGKYEIIGDEILLNFTLRNNKKDIKKQYNSEDQDINEYNNPDQLQEDSYVIEQDQYNDKLSYYSAEVKSFKCSCLVISKSDFRRMMNDYSEVKKYLKVKAKTKLEWMEQRQKQQAQLLKKITNNSNNKNNQSQQQLVKENHQLFLTSHIKRHLSVSKENSDNYQNNIMQQKSKSPSRQVKMKNLSKSEKKKNVLNNIVMSYFQKDFQSKDLSNLPQKSQQILKQNLNQTLNQSSDQIITDALAIKYSYQPNVLRSTKLKSSEVIDFIFNHQESSFQQQQENRKSINLQQLSQINFSNKLQYIDQYNSTRIKKQNENLQEQDKQQQQSIQNKSTLQSPSSNKQALLSPQNKQIFQTSQNKNKEQIDKEIMGKTDYLLDKIKRRRTMNENQQLEQKDSEHKRNGQIIKSEHKRSVSNTLNKDFNNSMNNTQNDNEQGAFNLEKPKNKLHISHEPNQLKQINKMNKEILKNNIQQQKSMPAFNQSNNFFMSNFSYSSKASMVTPTKYKETFNSKISKKREFESLFNNTMDSPKNKSIINRQQNQVLENTSLNKQKSNNSIISSESLSPIHKQSFPKTLLHQYSNNKQESSSNRQDSPQNSSLNLSFRLRYVIFFINQENIKKHKFDFKRKYSIGQSPLVKRQSVSIISADTPSMRKKLNSLNMQDQGSSQPQQINREPEKDERNKIKTVIQQNPQNPLLNNISKQGEFFFPSTNNTFDVDSKQNLQKIMENQQNIIKNEDDYQKQSEQQLNQKVQNYNSSRFRQSSNEQKKNIEEILNKYYTASTKSCIVSPKMPVKYKEVNIHVQQKNQRQKKSIQTNINPNGSQQSCRSQSEKRNNISQEEENGAQQPIRIQSSANFENSKQNEKQTMQNKRQSVFSLQALSNNKLESAKNLKDNISNNISMDKIVVINHMMKPINYHQYSQSSLINLDNQPQLYQNNISYLSGVQLIKNNSSINELQNQQDNQQQTSIGNQTPKEIDFNNQLAESSTQTKYKIQHKFNLNLNNLNPIKKQ